MDYRASVQDIADHLSTLMPDAVLREEMGRAARIHVVKHFDYRVVAQRFVALMQDKLGIH